LPTKAAQAGFTPEENDRWSGRQFIRAGKRIETDGFCNKGKAAGGRSWGHCQGTIFKALRQYKTTMRRSAAATAKCIQEVESPRIQFCKARIKKMPLAIDRLTTLRIWTIATFFDEPKIISHSRTFWLG
jgi:hypothetical protein